MSETPRVNERIARALGWTVEKREEWSLQGNDTFETLALYSPDDKIAWFHPLREPTEAECWSHVTDYEHDLNAVWQVCDHENGSLSVHRVGNKYFAFVNFYESGADFHESEGATAMEAAARALLAYLEAKAATS